MTSVGGAFKLLLVFASTITAGFGLLEIRYLFQNFFSCCECALVRCSGNQLSLLTDLYHAKDNFIWLPYSGSFKSLGFMPFRFIYDVYLNYFHIFISLASTLNQRNHENFSLNPFQNSV
jgi:hypothetical protein